MNIRLSSVHSRALALGKSSWLLRLRFKRVQLGLFSCRNEMTRGTLRVVVFLLITDREEANERPGVGGRETNLCSRLIR